MRSTERYLEMLSPCDKVTIADCVRRVIGRADGRSFDLRAATLTEIQAPLRVDRGTPEANRARRLRRVLTNIDAVTLLGIAESEPGHVAHEEPRR